MNKSNYRMPKTQRRHSMRCIFILSICGVAGAMLISQQMMVLLAIKAGAGEIFIGLLSFAGLAPFVLSLVTLPQIESLGKKFIVMRWTTMAVLLIIPLVFLPQFARICPLYVFMPIMFSFIAIRISAEGLGFAAWFPLLQDIVPQRVTGRFFGNLRTAWQSSGLVSMLLAAWFIGKDPQWWKFNVAFTLAFLFFAAKLYFLRPLAENPPKKSKHEQASIVEILRLFFTNKEQRMIMAYLLSYAFAFGVSIPFQVKFLKTLDYPDGFILAASAMVNGGAVLALRRWGKLADRFGNRSVFTISHAGMVLVTGLWLFVETGPVSSILVFCLFFFNSFFNSGNGIAQTRYIMHSIPQDRQTDITIINMLIIITWGISPLFAGIFLNLTDGFVFEAFGRNYGNYQLLFIINACLFLIPRSLRRFLQPQKDTPTVQVLATILRPRALMPGPFQRFVQK